MRHMRHRRPPILPLLLTIACLGSSSSLWARDYLIEVVVFEHLQPADSILPDQLYVPAGRAAFSLGTAAAESAGFRELAEEELDLAAHAETIAGARGYRLLEHLAWQQPGLDTDDAQAVQLRLGESITLYVGEDDGEFDTFIPADAQPGPERFRQVQSSTLNGTLTVRLGRFLHLESALVYTDIRNRRSYRLAGSRKMRSGELHYIDNERFGLLTRIRRADATDPAN